MRLQRIRILLLARDPVLLRNQLARHAHVLVVARAPQTITHHRIHRRRIAHSEPAARVGQKIRRVRHRLHPARHHDLRRTRHHASRRQRHRPQPAAANHVDRQRAHRIRQPSAQGGLPRRILPEPRRQHASHHALVDAWRRNTRARNRLPHRDRTQLHRAQRAQRALKLSHRRPHRTHNHDLSHPVSSRCPRPKTHRQRSPSLCLHPHRKPAGPALRSGLHARLHHVTHKVPKKSRETFDFS